MTSQPDTRCVRSVINPGLTAPVRRREAGPLFGSACLIVKRPSDLPAATRCLLGGTNGCVVHNRMAPSSRFRSDGDHIDSHNRSEEQRHCISSPSLRRILMRSGEPEFDERVSPRPNTRHHGITLSVAPVPARTVVDRAVPQRVIWCAHRPVAGNRAVVVARPRV